MAEEKKTLKLTLKKPGAAPAAAPAATVTAAAPAAGGVIRLVFQNAKIHIDQVIVKREEKK